MKLVALVLLVVLALVLMYDGDPMDFRGRERRDSYRDRERGMRSCRQSVQKRLCRKESRGILADDAIAGGAAPAAPSGSSAVGCCPGATGGKLADIATTEIVEVCE